MMHLGNRIFRTLLLLSLLSPLAVSAQTLISDEGKILRVSNTMLNLSDAAYAVSPTVQVRLLNNNPGQISDLKVGDYARVSVFKVGTKLTIDSIQLIENVQSNERMQPEIER